MEKRGRHEEGAVSPKHSRQLWAPGRSPFVDLTTVLKGISEFCSQGRVTGREMGQMSELHQATPNQKTEIPIIYGAGVVAQWSENFLGKHENLSSKMI